MSDTTQAIETLRQYAHSCHDEIAQAGAHLCDAYAELEKLAYGDPTEDELEADRVAIQRFQARLANDLRAAEERGRVATRIEWRGYLRKAIGRERELRAEVQAQAEEIARLRAVIAAAVQVSAERGENSSESRGERA